MPALALPDSLFSFLHQITHTKDANYDGLDSAMAALNRDDAPISSSDLAPYLPSQGLASRMQQELADSPVTAYHFKRAVDFATQIGSHELTKRAPSTLPNPTYHPGWGAKDPNTFNNKGWFALFGLIGAGMVITSIWFFFWARNGGFHFQKGDWDDYKSTVLRRKGPDGKTLSNATKSTNLGQKSLAGTFDLERQEMAEVQNFVDDRRKRRRNYGAGKREPSDEDVRAYRQEKPARVGGLNRQHDGSHWDPTNSERSEAMTEASDRPLYQTQPPKSPKKKGLAEKRREKKQVKQDIKRAQKTKDALRNGGGHDSPSRPSKAHRRSRMTADDSTIGDESEIYGGSNGNSNGTHNSYYAEYRNREPRAQPTSYRQSAPRQASREARRSPPSGSRQSSPRKSSQMPRYPGSFDAYSDVSSDSGTKVYDHPLPELRSGFRRGERLGRRDSLSDSDGDLGTGRRR